MTATFSHANNTRVKVGTSGSETDISDNVDNSYHLKRRPIHQNTGYGSGGIENAPGLLDPVTFLEGPWDQALHDVLAPLDGVAGKHIVYSPTGVTASASNPKIAYTGYLTGYKTTGDIDKGGRRWSAFFMHSSGYSDTTW